jgi:flagellar motor protein MotB
MKFTIYTLIFVFVFSATSYSQFEFLKRKAQEKIEKSLEKKMEESENPDEEKKEESAEKSENKENKEDETKATKLQSFTKYDFVPGEKVILYEDFSQDALGDFPALWTTDVPGEVNTLNIAPGKWFNLNSTEGTYTFLKNVEFPKNFIIEFDIIPKKDARRIAVGLYLYGEEKYKEFDDNSVLGEGGVEITLERESWGVTGQKSYTPDNEGSSTVNPVQFEKVNHVIIWVQNRRLRIYHQSAKVIDLPTVIHDGIKFNRFCFRLYRGASGSSYISNIRITDAAPDMRNKLLTEGKLVTYGIYFDVNKDVVKPESYGTLKGIADVLKENPDVKVKIVGHTDSDGADAANLELSKKRGEAVKNELIKTFGIDASRLESDGMGETKPVAPNDTPANKALNRRVEFIKL